MCERNGTFQVIATIKLTRHHYTTQAAVKPPAYTYVSEGVGRRPPSRPTEPDELFVIDIKGG